MHLLDEDIIALFKSIEMGDIKTVEKIVRKFPPIVHHLAPSSLFDPNGYTWNALHCASYYGQGKIVQLLLNNGSDVETVDTFHRAVMHEFF